VTVPVCLIASFIALYAFGFSINLLTLLALVLCIGLVVDDAIVVLENIQRRVDLGEPPLVAARRGTAQVAFAVIATTAVLVAVFLPVGFLEGNTGRLFRELSVALAARGGDLGLRRADPDADDGVEAAAPAHRARGEGEPGQRMAQRALPAIGRRLRRSSRGTVHRIWLFATLMIGAVVAMLDAVQDPAQRTGAGGRSRLVPDGDVKVRKARAYDYTVAQMKQVEQIMAGEIGDDKPILRANPRVPGSFGASEEMHTGRAMIFLQPWDKRRRAPPRSPASCEKKFAGMTGVRVLHASRRRAGAYARPAVPTWCWAARTTPSWPVGATSCWRRWRRTPASSVPIPTTRKPGRRCG
jgi:multidrug efflux pump